MSWAVARLTGIRDVPTYTQSTQMRTKIFQNKKRYMIFLLKQCHYARWLEAFSKNKNFDKFECNFAYHQKMSGYAPGIDKWHKNVSWVAS